MTCRMERCLGGCKCDPDTDPEPDPDAERLNKLLVEIALIQMTNFNRVAPGITLGVWHWIVFNPRRGYGF